MAHQAPSNSPFILEGIVTTLSVAGRVNIAPMGPELSCERGFPLGEIILKPFRDSTTFQNLMDTGRGVFHLTDDVALIARSALGDELLDQELRNGSRPEWTYLPSACSWHAFEVRAADGDGPRARFHCTVLEWGELRPFLGFNRAQNAIIELTIMATRVHLLAAETIQHELDRTTLIVGKTGGRREHEALFYLRSRLVGAQAG